LKSVQSALEPFHLPTIVITILNNPDSQVRQSATNVLEAIDPAAAAKAGIK
jgi:hypothetical protein